MPLSGPLAVCSRWSASGNEITAITTKHREMEAVKKKNSKGGRPKQASVRYKSICVRLSKLEHLIIESKAKKAGLKLTVYMREASKGASIKTRLTSEEQYCIQQLIGESNNINQIAKACHTKGILKAMLYYEGIKNRIDGVLEKLKP
jgi:hypothetical protein